MLTNYIVDVALPGRYIARLGMSITNDHHWGAKEHLLILSCIYLVGAVLAFTPHAVLELHYRCLLNTATGIRCPFCGMTRDFILMFHGSLPRNNPGSLLVAIAGYLVYPVWFIVATLCRPSWLVISRTIVQELLIGVLVALFMCNNLIR